MGVSAHESSLEWKLKAFSSSGLRRKIPLRTALKKLRFEQDPRVRHYKNAKIASTLQSLPEIQPVQTIALYASLPQEVSTENLITFFLKQGKKVVLPKVSGNHLDLFQIYDILSDLTETGSFGIREPNPQRCPAISISAVDLFITPGVGFDLFGYRLGMGKGYYDRLLAQKRKDSQIIGLAFDFQVIHALETNEFDIPMDRIVTEAAVYAPAYSEIRTKSEYETRKWAGQLYRRGMSPGDVWVLHGDLGTGKTVFVHGIADALQTTRETASPTFVFCREYFGTNPLYHVDCYRMDNVQVFEQDFWAELLERPGIIAIEWGERLGAMLPKNAIHLFGKNLGDQEREWVLFTPLQSQQVYHDDD